MRRMPSSIASTGEGEMAPEPHASDRSWSARAILLVAFFVAVPALLGFIRPLA
jgi:hypothetical protein